MHPIAAAATMMKQEVAANTATLQLNKYFSPKAMAKVTGHPGF